MNRSPSLRLAALAALLALAAVATGCSGDDSDSDGDGSTETTATDTTTAEVGFEGELTGTFEITAGECTDAGVTAGSFFRMVQPGGTVEDGPFIDNGDSVCGDTTFTVLSPGTEGGLSSGVYQPAGDPAFDEAGNALSETIIAPVTFFGLAFSAATDETDAQSGDAVPAPQLSATDGQLSGDVSALAAYYGGEVFNQGAPKPGGENPGLTSGPTGTIDPETGEFVLEWVSQIEGGAFNEFSGVWHLEGTFSPA
jgi:hypothetical protein